VKNLGADTRTFGALTVREYLKAPVSWYVFKGLTGSSAALFSESNPMEINTSGKVVAQEADRIIRRSSGASEEISAAFAHRSI